MSQTKRSVAFCVLGESRERGTPASEPLRFRPVLDLCASTRPRIDRLELLVAPERLGLAAALQRQLSHVAPRTEVHIHEVKGLGGAALGDVHGALTEVASRYAFSPEDEEYLLHLSSGSALQQVAWIWLWGARRWPGRLAFAPRNERNEASGIALIDHPEARSPAPLPAAPAPAALTHAATEPGVPPSPNRGAEGFWIRGRDAALARSHPGPLWLYAPSGSDQDACIDELEALYRAQELGPGPHRVDVACAAVVDAESLRRALDGRASEGLPSEGRAPARAGLWVLHEPEALSPGIQAALALHLAARTRQSPAEPPCVIAVSHISPGEAAEAAATGRLRVDLWSALQGGALAIPSFEACRHDLGAWLRAAADREAGARGGRVGFDEPALTRIRARAAEPGCVLPGGFRDLRAILTRLASLADAAGRASVGVDDVEEALSELSRRVAAFREPPHPTKTARGPGARELPSARLLGLLGEARAAQLDRFERVQLEDVLDVCVHARTLSEAGRVLFAASRAQKRSANDADRLRKYLARHDLRFDELED